MLLGFLLAAPADAAPPRHAVVVGLVGGVNLLEPSPEVMLGLTSPLPAPLLGYTMDLGAPAGVWLGLHTAPTLFVVAGRRSDGDLSTETVNVPVLIADLGYELHAGPASVGPYAGIGLISAEAGLRVRSVPHRVGPELRLAWTAPKAVVLTVAGSFGVSRER